MKNYLDRITRGYVAALSKFNELDTAVRSMFAHNHLTGGEMDGSYIHAMLRRNEARKILNRWYAVFNSVCKRSSK